MSTALYIPSETAASPEPSTLPETTAQSAPESAALQRCMDAWNENYRATLHKKKSQFFAEDAAGDAYRAAIPELTSPANLRAFIACVSRGILLGAIDAKQAPKLLYAAQVASGIFKLQSQPDKSKSAAKVPTCEP